MTSKLNQSLVLYRYPEDPGEKMPSGSYFYSEDKQSLCVLKDA